MNKSNTQTKNTDFAKAVFIINPVSGIGDGQKKKEEIKKYATELGWKGKIFETTKKINASIIAKKEIEKGAKHIVACGGDGTIMEVLQVVNKRPVAIGVIPLGTGNLFAQNLKIPNNYKEATRIALLGHIQKIDLGQANGIFFSIIAGIGIDAEIMRNTDRATKNKLGFVAYIIGGLKSLGGSSGLYKISVDGKKPRKYKAKSIMIANMGRIQAGIEAVPGTSASNGILKIGIMQASGFFHWIDLLINILKGNISRSSHYKLLTGKKVSIVSLNGKKPFQCDGDLFDPVEKLDVEIFPQNLSIMIK